MLPFVIGTLAGVGLALALLPVEWVKARWKASVGKYVYDRAREEYAKAQAAQQPQGQLPPPEGEAK